MKLYIPQIGDKLQLISDWTFTLIGERRNKSLFKVLFPKEKDLRLYEPVDKVADGYFHSKFTDIGDVIKDALSRLRSCREIYEMNLYDQNVGSGWNVYKYSGLFSVPGSKRLPFTFPAGTILIVDRIYIRKGNESYSSVTFRTISTDKNLNKKRFFAKLDDCNNIEFNLV